MSESDARLRRAAQQLVEAWQTTRPMDNAAIFGAPTCGEAEPLAEDVSVNITQNRWAVVMATLNRT